MADGIFVAHNVNFDYGFISYEYDGSSAAFVFRSCAPLQECVGVLRGISPMALENYANIRELNSKRTTGRCAMPGHEPSSKPYQSEP